MSHPFESKPPTPSRDLSKKAAEGRDDPARRQPLRQPTTPVRHRERPVRESGGGIDPNRSAQPGRVVPQVNYRSRPIPAVEETRQSAHPGRTAKGQYKSGVSGNLKGRPKASKNISKLLEKELNRKITIRSNGKSKEVSARQGVAMRVIRDALDGKSHLMRFVLDFEKEREQQTSVIPENRKLSKSDADLLAQLIKISRK